MYWQTPARGYGGIRTAMGATLAERLKGPFTGLRTSPAPSSRSHAASASGSGVMGLDVRYPPSRSSGGAGLLEDQKPVGSMWLYYVNPIEGHER
jgi:hypothetical protein